MKERSYKHCCLVAHLCPILQPHGLQQARLPCPSPSPRDCSNSCPLSRWCHPTISPSVATFSPVFNLSQHQGLFQWVGSLHQNGRAIEPTGRANRGRYPICPTYPHYMWPQSPGTICHSTQSSVRNKWRLKTLWKTGKNLGSGLSEGQGFFHCSTATERQRVPQPTSLGPVMPCLASALTAPVPAEPQGT